jgi:hypothetical protein
MRRREPGLTHKARPKPKHMKEPVPKPKRTPLNLRAVKILKSLRNARKHAVEIAREHRTRIIYMQDGKLVKERP